MNVASHVKISLGRGRSGYEIREAQESGVMFWLVSIAAVQAPYVLCPCYREPAV